MQLSTYEDQLLSGWEDVFKKGQLTLWVMLALKDGPKYMAEIRQFVGNLTDYTLGADDQSMYRALRRYHDAELVEYMMEPNEEGPDRKVYGLTEIGYRVLADFLERNIKVFYKPSIKHLIERSVE